MMSGLKTRRKHPTHLRHGNVFFQNETRSSCWKPDARQPPEQVDRAHWNGVLGSFATESVFACADCEDPDTR